MQEKEEKITLNYEVSKDLYDQVKIEAERLGVSLAGFMRMLAVNYFERKKD